MAETVRFHFDVDGENFTMAGQASVAVKKNLRQLGVSPETIRRVSIAMYEGEINMVIHAGGGEAENGGRSLGAAAQAAFLTAAQQQSREGLEPGANVQCTGTLRAVNLVGRNGNQIRTQGFGGKGNLQKALNRIRMENGIGTDLVGQLCHLGNGHHGANLVIYRHTGNKDCFIVYGFVNIFFLYFAVLIRGKAYYLHTCIFKPFYRLCNAWVLNRGGNYSVALSFKLFVHAENSGIVCSST